MTIVTSLTVLNNAAGDAGQGSSQAAGAHQRAERARVWHHLVAPAPHPEGRRLALWHAAGAPLKRAAVLLALVPCRMYLRCCVSQRCCVVVVTAVLV